MLFSSYLFINLDINTVWKYKAFGREFLANFIFYAMLLSLETKTMEFLDNLAIAYHYVTRLRSHLSLMWNRYHYLIQTLWPIVYGTEL